jgi:hypothetical protein
MFKVSEALYSQVGCFSRLFPAAAPSNGSKKQAITVPKIDVRKLYIESIHKKVSELKTQLSEVLTDIQS